MRQTTTEMEVDRTGRFGADRRPAHLHPVHLAESPEKQPAHLGPHIKEAGDQYVIPLAAGGFFVIGLLYRCGWIYVAPSCLVFYGLALVNASKYTLTDIRYLGLLEIALGCICMYYPHDGLYFWAAGFGVLHIVYGLIMWWKYEKS